MEEVVVVSDFCSYPMFSSALEAMQEAAAMAPVAYHFQEIQIIMELGAGLKFF